MLNPDIKSTSLWSKNRDTNSSGSRRPRLQSLFKMIVFFRRTPFVARAHCVCHGAKLSCQAESQKTLFFFFWRKRNYFENVSGLGGNIGFSGWQAESFPWWGDISRSLAHCGVFRWQAEALLNRELLKQLGHKLWRQNGGCSPNEVCLLLTCSLHSGISSVNCGFPLIVTLKEDSPLLCSKGTQFWHQQTLTVQEQTVWGVRL